MTGREVPDMREIIPLSLMRRRDMSFDRDRSSPA
jgi:hypothetical protein